MWILEIVTGHRVDGTGQLCEKPFVHHSLVRSVAAGSKRLRKNARHIIRHPDLPLVFDTALDFCLRPGNIGYGRANKLRQDIGDGSLDLGFVRCIGSEFKYRYVGDLGDAVGGDVAGGEGAGLGGLDLSGFGDAVGFAAADGEAFVDGRLVISEIDKAIDDEGERFAAVLGRPGEILAAVLVDLLKLGLTIVDGGDKTAELCLRELNSLEIPRMSIRDSDEVRLDLAY